MYVGTTDGSKVLVLYIITSICVDMQQTLGPSTVQTNLTQEFLFYNTCHHSK
jgi:hypothetical protein